MNRKKILIAVILFTAMIILLLIILNQSTRYKSVSINESNWAKIIETHSENNNLVLNDIEFNDYDLIIDEKNNTLYYSLVNESQNKYNPSITYKTFDKDVKIAILLDEITDEKVKSDYKFKIMIYNENEYRIYNLVCTDLPVLDIMYKEDVGSKQKNIPVEIYLFDNLSNIPNKITRSLGKFTIREDGYLFSLNMMTPGRNMRDNKISILNMKPNSEYILTLITNNEYENIVEMSEGRDKGTRNQRVELFINSEYKGIYLLGHLSKGNKSDNVSQ